MTKLVGFLSTRRYALFLAVCTVLAFSLGGMRSTNPPLMVLKEQKQPQHANHHNQTSLASPADTFALPPNTNHSSPPSLLQTSVYRTDGSQQNATNHSSPSQASTSMQSPENLAQLNTSLWNRPQQNMSRTNASQQNETNHTIPSQKSTRMQSPENHLPQPNTSLSNRSPQNMSHLSPLQAITRMQTPGVGLQMNVTNQSRPSSTTPLEISDHGGGQLNTNHSNQQPHTMPLDFFPFRKWEEESIGGTRVCKPGNNIPQHCCVGSTSTGGALGYKPGLCNFTRDLYHQAHEHVWHYMKDHGLLSLPPPTNSTRCDSCHIVDQLIQYNLNLSFVGDSLTHQSFGAFECDLRRQEGLYQIQSTKDFRQTPEGQDRRHIVVEYHSVHVKGKEGETTLRMYRYFRPDISHPNVMDEILESSNVVIFDHGLHWTPNEREGFRKAMEYYLQRYRTAYSNLTLLAWRETTAQHFYLDGGHFEMQVKRENRFSECVPIESAHSLDHRPAIMQEAANKSGFSWVDMEQVVKDLKHLKNHTNHLLNIRQSPPELVFLPFREYSVPLHYLHASECTHYCHTPTFWQPAWHSFRLALDRALLRKARARRR